ncbi:preprotein translocase subunit YajC [Halomonas nitroreducens]|uniref:Preprotein translocase subunit YajC n=1 Tax=Halomonas nitroreducens TaxID=447425 RepID=A0A3S0JV37_9GAMM|nr:preprotein translocase subunit YajC [Halomonas nitroreducens]RTQ98347.1 preprotein translocase subunit YajC [Halomonas nitroreducens]
MVWLIILGVVGLVFAPAMWLRPSPRQQRLIQLREAARHAGIIVRIENSPLHDGGEMLPAYRWPYPAQQPGPDFVLVRDAVASQALKRYQAGWRWRMEPLRPLPDAAQERLLALLARLPEDALVVESGAAALTLWWDESLDIASLESLAADFAELRDSLANRPDRPGAHRRLQSPRA